MLLALLRQYVRPYRWLVAAVMVLQIISTLASLYLPTVNASIIDDGVAKGDTGLITELGLVMLAVTALQGVCAVGAVYFGSRTGMGFGRDLRSAMFHHVTTFSERETARFGAPSLLTRTTNDVQQIQVLVQMTATVMVTAPIMCVGGIFMAIHQDAGLSWLLLVSVPVLALSNYWVVSHMLPIFRSMQRLIDGINRVMREQLSGIRVIRAFAREPFERERFEQANAEVSNTALAAGQWQEIKQGEKGGASGQASLLGEQPKGLPALVAAYRIQEKAGAVGFDWPDLSGPLAKVHEELGELELELGRNRKSPGPSNHRHSGTGIFGGVRASGVDRYGGRTRVERFSGRVSQEIFRQAF